MIIMRGGSRNRTIIVCRAERGRFGREENAFVDEKTLCRSGCPVSWVDRGPALKYLGTLELKGRAIWDRRAASRRGWWLVQLQGSQTWCMGLLKTQKPRRGPRRHTPPPRPTMKHKQ